MINPLTDWGSYDAWIVLVGVLSAVACAIPGCFLLLRGMSMMGDAISHAVLPGLALAYLITGSRTSVAMFIGAAFVGVMTAVFTQWISRFGKVDRGAAMGIVFTTLFAFGLVLIEKGARNVDLDASCVLYGAIELTPVLTLHLGSWEVPEAVILTGAMVLLNVLLVLLFFKELKICSFDPGLATTLGIPSELVNYGLMVMVALTTVACFEVVGSIIVIAMLIVPAATAFLMTRRLVPMLWAACGMAALSAVVGHALAGVVPSMLGFASTSTSGMIAVASGGLFTFVWIGCLILKKLRSSKESLDPTPDLKPQSPDKVHE